MSVKADIDEVTLGGECSGVASITIEKEPEGDSLIFIAETRNAVEVSELRELCSDLEHGCKVRMVAVGPVTAFAIKPFSEEPGHLADFYEVTAVLEAIAPRYKAAYLQPLDATSYRIVEDLALETGSELMPLNHCDLCGRPEAFPTTLAAGEKNRRLAAGAYCSRCIAELNRQNDYQLVSALLNADKRNFGNCVHVELTNKAKRHGGKITFSARRRGQTLAATG
ncbi:MAG: hypothetical protein ACP5R4_02815 [Armatimonadota bacterium]